MPPICLTDIKDIANIIKQKYSASLDKMIFVFCYKQSDGKYLIFQELYSVPIQRFVYHSSNDSISFSAAWAAWGNPYALVADTNFDQVEVWQDLLDRSRLYNTDIKEHGGFSTSTWKSGNRCNRTEKNKRKKTQFDSFFEFRTDKINRAAFYEWGFEIYSSALSFIARKDSYCFPYGIDDKKQDEDIPHSMEISHNGQSFDIKDKIIYGIGPFSYWDKNECDPANVAFDEEITKILMDKKTDIDGILNVGQRVDKKTDIDGILNVGQREINLLL
jgi:hypothetical protein